MLEKIECKKDVLGYPEGFLQMLVEEALNQIANNLDSNSIDTIKKMLQSIDYIWYAVNEVSKGADLRNLDGPGICEDVEKIKLGIYSLGGTFAEGNGVILNSQGQYDPGHYVNGEFVHGEPASKNNPFVHFQKQIICNRCNSVLGERVKIENVEDGTFDKYGGVIFYSAEGICSGCGNQLRITEKPGKGR